MDLVHQDGVLVRREAAIVALLKPGAFFGNEDSWIDGDLSRFEHLAAALAGADIVDRLGFLAMPADPIIAIFIHVEGALAYRNIIHNSPAG